MAEDKDKKPKGDINSEYNQGFKGLNMDSVPSQVDKGALSYALNAAIENFDNNSITYQNEPANEFCLNFPLNYILIGKYFIPEQTKQIFFLSNPSTGDSEIGYMENNDCVYKTLVNAKCLNFDPRFPIHKAVHKTSNCGTELYWAQPNADRRYINLDPKKLPFLPIPGSTPCDEVLSNQLDCNQLRVQPNYTIPQLFVSDVIIGGNLVAGTYQFCIQYSDASGNPLSSVHSITNPTPIADPQFSSVNFNYPVGKSILVDIANIEIGGQFDYFNLIVIKSINAITSVELVGTYNIDSDHKVITYSGQNQTAIRLTINDVFEKFPFYGPADDVTTAQNVLIWKGLSTPERISYQQIANQITLMWETYRIPATENYADEINATHLRGYLRDEVYPFEFVPLLRSGRQCDGFHIPGRALTLTEKSLPRIAPTDPDFIGNPDEDGKSPFWKIYNTAIVVGNSTAMPVAENYKGRYNYGTFAYWESSEVYPCDETIWGDLAGQPIRHHKFPDVAVSPIIEAKQYNGKFEMGNVAVFPIGVRIDVDQIKLLISQSSLTDEQKADIVGFKIVRGDRTDNKSIVAKGILRNVGKYKREEQEFFFPNYPYNDLGQDPFINAVNNSYSLETTSWLIICSETGTFQIGDLSTDKPSTRPMTAGQTYEVCSTTRPVSITGKALIGPSQYDVYRIKIEKCSFEAKWVDPFTDNNQTSASKTKKLVHVVGSVFNTIYCRVAVGAKVDTSDCKIGVCLCFVEEELIEAAGPSGEAIIDPAGGTVTEPHISRRTAINCKNQVPLAPIISTPELAYRQVFNSPETSFGQPFLGDVLKLESVIFGGGLAHFVKVKDNAEYRLLTKEAQEDALISAGNIGNGDATATFTAYQAYLEIYINGITRKNYAYSYNSIADYNYSLPVPNAVGVKQRALDLKRYLIPAVLNIGERNSEEETVDINNYQRETSVYLRTIGSTNNSVTPLPFPHLSPNIAPTGIQEFSRYTAGCAGTPLCPTTTPTTTQAPVPAFCKGSCAEPERKQDIQVVSYYASLKNTFIGQWGQIYSYQTIDTGFQIDFTLDAASSETDLLPTKVIFGGDTFISRFAFKTKLPFFIDNRVGAPDDSEIFYDELGNIGYPKFWHSGRSILSNFNVPKLGDMTNIVSYKAHNFDCPNCQAPAPDPNRTFYDGMFYLFAYGVPNFYVETSYNTDLRQAFNNKEGDFWPHVSNSIPDDWVQESFVSIANDNTYYYNGSFSKQNTENLFTHIPAGYKFDICSYDYPFRAIFSDPQIATADVTVNNWLTYRAVSYFDFPQNYGDLTSLDGIERGQVLARFENKALYYNALYTTQTNTNGQVYLGQSLFSKNTPPIDFAETDLGYLGSQHKFLLKLPHGQITIDAARGQIFLLGKNVEEISGPGSGMNRFFTDHLSFEILRYFPDREEIDPDTQEKTFIPGVNVDNHFNGIGLHGVYDSKFDRIIITKLDYVPLSDEIVFDGDEQKFYIITETESGDFRNEVFLTDPVYFCNKSWTLSYSFITKSWLSFHSYLPNWYIGENNFFYSGIKDCCNPVKFIAGELIANPVTTTTTSTFPVPPTTTSTTTIGPDCNLIGGDAQGTNCELAGTGLITVIPVPPPCTRPSTVQAIQLYTGYEIVSPPITVNSTLSASDACNAKQYLYDHPNDAIPTAIVGYGENIAVGNKIYADNGTNDCAPVADGFYYTPDLADLFVYQIVGGVVVSATACVVTTTTTSSTTCTMYLHSFEVYTCTTCSPSVTGVLGNSELLTVGKFYYDSVTAAKIKILSFDGCSGGSDRSILDSTKEDTCPAVSCP